MKMCLLRILIITLASLEYFTHASGVKSTIIIVEDAKACFRRVLAGKRIAPHWARRTIACERVEDCMRECGHEKRFMCEGFNYRLDPSGHGQGDCELIDIPLAQMDLYSALNEFQHVLTCELIKRHKHTPIIDCE